MTKKQLSRADLLVALIIAGQELKNDSDFQSTTLGVLSRRAINDWHDYDRLPKETTDLLPLSGQQVTLFIESLAGAVEYDADTTSLGIIEDHLLASIVSAATSAFVEDWFATSVKSKDRVLVPNLLSQRGYDNIKLVRNWPTPGILPGLIPVVGDVFAGKSYYVQKLLPDFVIRVDEPYEDYDALATSWRTRNFLEAVFVSSVLGLADATSVIDGARSLVYASGGSSALEGGISATLFSTLSTLNNFYVSVGLCVPLTLNPMLSDSEKTSRLFKRIAGSTVGAVLIEENAIAQSTYRLADKRVWLNGVEARRPDSDLTGPLMKEFRPLTAKALNLPQDTRQPSSQESYSLDGIDGNEPVIRTFTTEL